VGRLLVARIARVGKTPARDKAGIPLTFFSKGVK